jgi:hypothetical protein
MTTDDPAWALGQHLCRTGYEDLPASAVASARRDILDTFGCMLGGSDSPGIGELFAAVSRWGGLAESRVLLRGASLPAPQAALLNASMGHALDFDDTLDTGGSIHPGECPRNKRQSGIERKFTAALQISLVAQSSSGGPFSEPVD